MTQLLEQAWQEIQKLPTGEQDAIAAIILQELADERRWEEAFSNSQSQLEGLAAKVRAEIARGKVHDRGFDEL